MTLQSISIEITQRRKKNKVIKKPEFAFLKRLHNDLQAMGRDDVCLVQVGGILTFIWSTKYNRPASKALRAAVARARLIKNLEALIDFEKRNESLFSSQFTVDTNLICPVIEECDGSHEKIDLFNYYAFKQSIPSKVARGRFGRFLVYDESLEARPLMGIIGLSSPVYFNGARDKLFGWLPIGQKINGEWIEDAGAKAIRDEGLLSLSHITIAGAVPPYDQLKIARLISALCFCPKVVSFMEKKYGKPLACLTTTGGWGTNAAPYQRIRLGRDNRDSSRELFKEMKPKSPSLNKTLDFFSDELIKLAFELHRVRANESSEPYRDYHYNNLTRNYLLRFALKYIGLPLKAVYVNQIGHFVGTVTDDAIEYLGDVRSRTVPQCRTVAVVDAVRWWRERTDHRKLLNVRSDKLSTWAN